MTLKNILTSTLLIIGLGLPLDAKDVDTLADKKIVFVGDSITQDARYVSYVTYYLNRLHPDKKFDITGLGLGSETLSGLSEEGHAGGKFPRPCLFERLGRLLEKTKPEIVFACYGMNDGIYQPLDEQRFDAFRKGVNKLITQCKEAGVKEIFLITPPIHDDPKGATTDYDKVMAAYAAWQVSLKIPNVHVIDLHTAMRKARDARNELFSKDRVHPGDEGHLLMAKTILDGIGVKIPEESPATIQADPLFTKAKQLIQHRWTHWMKHIGYTREKTVAPQPLGDAETQASTIQEEMDTLRRQAQSK